MERRKVALVTGASSGFGQLTAGLLAEKGLRVFGTSRRPNANPPGVEMLELDVTSTESTPVFGASWRTATASIFSSTTRAKRTPP
jgi:NADP-dependent 3-hydroxy acid dehydrogenase YdfG